MPIRRWTTALGLAAGLLTLSGCATSSGLFGEPTTTLGSKAVSPPAELSPRLAVKASMAVGISLEKNGDDEAAIGQFDKVLEHDPDNIAALQHLAALRDRRCEFKEADLVYQRLAKARPRTSNVYSDWGYSYYLRNNWPEAEQQLRHALELDSHNGHAHCNLGLVLGQQGRYPEAMREFQAAPMSEAEAHCNLAFVYWSQNKLDDAKRECQIAREMEPKCIQAKELLARLEAPRDSMQARASAAAGLPPAHTAQPKPPGLAARAGSAESWKSVPVPSSQTALPVRAINGSGYAPYTYSAAEGTPGVTTIE